MKLTRLTAIILLALFAAVGCSDSKKVGSAIDVESLDAKARRLGKLDLPKEKESGGGFVGEKEQAAAEQEQQNAAQAAQQQQQQEEAVAAKKEAPASVTFVVNASGYDPYFIRVFKGGTVSVTNRDSVDRSVTADRGEFDSGPIAAGETWTYTADRIGKFNFHDETRPFVVGTLEVLAQ